MKRGKVVKSEGIKLLDYKTIQGLKDGDLFIKSHSRNNLLQNSNPKRIICYGCVGLLLRSFDERSRTNPP